MNWNSSRDSKDLSEAFPTSTWINNDSIISNTSLSRKENRGTNHTKIGITKAESWYCHVHVILTKLLAQ